jgi:hypothetical protein
VEDIWGHVRGPHKRKPRFAEAGEADFAPVWPGSDALCARPERVGTVKIGVRECVRMRARTKYSLQGNCDGVDGGC